MKTFSAALCLSFLAFPAWAASFVVGVEETQYYPQYTYENGQYGGFAREVLDAFAADRGHQFTYKALPVVRLFSEFAAGGVDLKYPDNQQWSPDVKAGKSVSYSAALVTNIDGVSVLAARKDASLESIKTLGTVKGFTAWSWAEQIKSGKVQLHENNTFSGLVQQTLAGRVDGAYASVSVVGYQLKSMNKEGTLVFAPHLPNQKSNYHLSSIKHPQLIAEFDQWMVEKAAVLAEMKKKYQVE